MDAQAQETTAPDADLTAGDLDAALEPALAGTATASAATDPSLAGTAPAVIPAASAEPGSGVDYEAFRSIMGSFASGISILTAYGADGEPYGMTCSAVCSVSADPPLLLACVRTPSATLDAIRASGGFAVNFLDAGAVELSNLFAGRAPDKFARAGWTQGGTTGHPILHATLAHAECAVHDQVEAGDHVIVIGRVLAGQVLEDRFPLGYWRGSYVRMFRLAQH